MVVTSLTMMSISYLFLLFSFFHRVAFPGHPPVKVTMLPNPMHMVLLGITQYGCLPYVQHPWFTLVFHSVSHYWTFIYLYISLHSDHLQATGELMYG